MYQFFPFFERYLQLCNSILHFLQWTVFLCVRGHCSGEWVNVFCLQEEPQQQGEFRSEGAEV